MHINLTGKILWALCFAGLMTLWIMFFQTSFVAWLDGQGYNWFGLGGTYISYLVPCIVAIILVGLRAQSFNVLINDLNLFELSV